jgi:hypothetical protein
MHPPSGVEACGYGASSTTRSTSPSTTAASGLSSGRVVDLAALIAELIQARHEGAARAGSAGRRWWC